MPFSSRAVSISTKVALPSMVTSVRVGSALPSVVHLPIAGCHALIEQNGRSWPYLRRRGVDVNALCNRGGGGGARAEAQKRGGGDRCPDTHKFHSPDCPLQACSRRRAPDLIAKPDPIWGASYCAFLSPSHDQRSPIALDMTKVRNPTLQQAVHRPLLQRDDVIRRFPC